MPEQELIDYWKQYKQECINWFPNSPQAEKLRLKQIEMVERTIEVLSNNEVRRKK